MELMGQVSPIDLKTEGVLHSLLSKLWVLSVG